MRSPELGKKWPCGENRMGVGGALWRRRNLAQVLLESQEPASRSLREELRFVSRCSGNFRGQKKNSEVI